VRNEPPFSCPQCGDTGIGGDRCLRCKIDMLDRAGRPVLAPSAVFLSLPTLDGFTHPWAMWATGAVFLICLVSIPGADAPWWVFVIAEVALWAAILGTFVLIKDRRVKQHRSRIQAVRARLAGSGAVTPILDAGGIARIRGKISVIKPVNGPLGEPVAAYLVRASKETVELLPAGRGQTRRAVTALTVEESSACGTFIVRDESGAALIDDDAYTLASPALVDMPWNEPISIVLKDGAEVEILGAAARKPVSAYPDLAQSGGYREAPSILVFDGSPEQRVLLIASPRSGG
jgi:hypothetical protein